jgi:hypothetical protein
MTQNKKNMKELVLIKFSLLSFLKEKVFLCIDDVYILNNRDIKGFITLRRLLLSSVTPEVLHKINDIFSVSVSLGKEKIGTHSILEFLSTDIENYGCVDVYYKEDKWKEIKELEELSRIDY